MQYHAARIEHSRSSKYAPQHSTLQDRADDLLVAIAVVGLCATIVDGNADYREINSFSREFRKQFALSRRHSLKLISVALRRIRHARQGNIIDCACDTLNAHFDLSQKTRLFEGLVEILIADGKVHNEEEYFLDYVASKLGLMESLKKRYPFV